MTQEIWITGAGGVLPGAIGREQISARLFEGSSMASPIERFDATRWRAHTAAVIRDFKAREFVPVAKLRRMNELSKMAVAATRMALDDRGWEPGHWPRTETGVALGTMFGPVRTSVEYMDAYLQHGPALAPPQLFAESVANAPGSHIAIEYGFEGFNLTCTQREISFTTALLQATLQLRRGAVRRAIVCGVDEMNEIVFEVLARAGSLAHDDGDGEAMRPFDRRANGFVVGEGALSLLVESEPGPAPLARVAGVGIARDSSATVHDWGTGSGSVARACRRALETAGVAVGDVSAVYASANGRPKVDQLEARAITELFDVAPPVVAPKAVFGEYAGASAVPLAAAALSIASQRLMPSAGFEVPCSDLSFEPVTEARDVDLRHVLVITTSAGGGVVAVVLSRP